MVFHDGIDLPHFASFVLLDSHDGCRRIEAYFEHHAEITIRHGAGLILDTPTWRANADWTAKFGHDALATAAVNRHAAELLVAIRDRLETPESPMVVNGSIGPRGDGYQTGTWMTADAAQAYHAAQIETLAGTEVDFVAAYTLNYVEEAIGSARAARAVSLPVVISFTVETDGRLPSGQSLGDATETVDGETGAAPAYFMLNCSHFADVLTDAQADGASWIPRLRGLRANASRLSHAELDQAETLDDGNPHELGRQYAALIALLPDLAVFGGCCGTDHRHVEQIGLACGDGSAARAARAA